MIEKLIREEIDYFSPMLERQKITSEEVREAWRQETVAQRVERVSLETYDLCNGLVSRGPFQGLKLNKDTWWGKSDLGSQCLGLYEAELLDLIASKGPFDTFLDIGAADGYYAVGMLHSKMAKQAICYEVSQDGQRAIKENWLSNQSPGRMLIYGEANEESITSIAPSLGSDSLVLIDVEGFEFSLLTSRVVSLLSRVKVIIEIHNWVPDFIQKYSSLLRRLDEHFEINVIEPSGRNTQQIDLLRSFTDDNRLLVASERRPCMMRFLFLEPKP